MLATETERGGIRSARSGKAECGGVSPAMAGKAECGIILSATVGYTTKRGEVRRVPIVHETPLLQQPIHDKVTQWCAKPRSLSGSAFAASAAASCQAERMMTWQELDCFA